MAKYLIIVESPTKIKTLMKFLVGKDFTFESSMGHIRDLPAKKFGIDVDNNFSPQYEVLEGKKDVIAKLKKAAQGVDMVYLAPDPDREGEAIAWHITAILPKGTKYKRITFNEITKDAVLNAINHPRDIDENLVNAQQARRLLDRMVGYKISPILQRKIKRGDKNIPSLSAGRVQSVALKLVVDREKEIEAFKSVEYWNLGATLKKGSQSFQSNVYSIDGKRVEKEKTKENTYLISNEKDAFAIKAKLNKAAYFISKVERKEKKKNPVPPFTTSTLQQEAARHFGFSVSKTMMVAQTLYEGVDLGNEGENGLITYMRTDSVRVSEEAIAQARSYITSTYGVDYIPDIPNVYPSKKNSQDAHEAIRPTHIEHAPDKIKDYLSIDQYKLYLLIWRRLLASQMKSAIYDTVAVHIDTDQNLILNTTGSVIKFQGFLIIYEEKGDEGDEGEKEKNQQEKSLPELNNGDNLLFIDSFANQAFTKPPARFTEASLVKELEKSGIGRPSTYAAIMKKILGHAYTVKEKSTLKPTELGRIICQMLEENFQKIMDIKFTAEMEDSLDKIAETNMNWQNFLKEFWDDFLPTVEIASEQARVPKLTTDIECPKCGGKLQKIWARGKYFYGCENYPECPHTAPLEELTFKKEDYADDVDWDQKCSKCKNEMKVRQSRFGIFLGCTKYPECKTIVNIPKKGEVLLENLPKCPAIGCDGQITQRRSRFGKTFFSCSTYPNCDVIANSVDQLLEKYENHTKTPYQKQKAKGRSVTTKKQRVTTKKAIANQPLYVPSKILEQIIGKESVTRQQGTKKLWEYIKKHDLQDKSNRRKIVPDDKLAAFFDQKEPLDMMKLAGILSKHLTKDIK